MLKKYYFQGLLIFCLLSGLLFGFSAKADQPDAPTLLKINNHQSYSFADPVISGVVPKGSRVLVYVDGVFFGNAVIQENKSDVNSFYLQLFSLSEGEHRAYLISENIKDLSRSINSAEFKFQVAAVPAPTLIEPDEETITGKVKPIIKGLTKSGTFVHLYIDGVYNGRSQLVKNDSGTADFSYRPFHNLSIGEHKMWAVAETASGKKSKVSAVTEFSIENQMPAPTLISARTTQTNEIVVSGLAKNNSHIKIFVDHKLYGDFQVKNDKSGTANFVFRIRNKNRGLIYATATDKRGKESLWSNLISPKTIVKPVLEKTEEKPLEAAKPEISKEAVNEEKGVTVEIDEKKENQINEKKIEDYLVFARLRENDHTIKLSQEQYKELRELLNNIESYDLSDNEKRLLENLLEAEKITDEENENNKSKEESDLEKKATSTGAGMMDENKNDQGKIGWNALIFLLFLVAVIAWIFWVNRELIKEKKEQEEKEKKENEK